MSGVVDELVEVHADVSRDELQELLQELGAVVFVEWWFCVVLVGGFALQSCMPPGGVAVGAGCGP